MIHLSHAMIEMMRTLYILKSQNQTVTISKLKRNVNYTYVSTYNIVRQFESLGWVRLFRKGKYICIDLTEKGLKIAELCYELLREVENGVG